MFLQAWPRSFQIGLVYMLFENSSKNICEGKLKPVLLDSSLQLADVSIAVLSYNRKDVLEPNLNALMALAENFGCELIVIDNASVDGSADMIAQMIVGRRNTQFIANTTNLGVAGGRNTSWRAVTRPFILNIDDDTFVSAEAIAIMLSLMRTRPDVGIISPRILHAVTKKKQLDLGDHLYSLANFHGACHLVRTALVEQIGVNDELCSFGGEEIDYSIRARARGFDVVYTPDATVLHQSIIRTGKIGGDRRCRWLYNFIRIYHKHFPLGFASLLSGRYLLSHFVSGVRVHGPLFAVYLLAAAFRGFRDGRREYSAIPADVVRFYRDPDLRPEFGNRPIWRKFMTKLGCG